MAAETNWKHKVTPDWGWLNYKHNLYYHCHLTHCGLVTRYGDRDLGQHLLRLRLDTWQHQAITWTNVDWSSVKTNDSRIRTISQEMSSRSDIFKQILAIDGWGIMPQPSIAKICLKISKILFKFLRGQQDRLEHLRSEIPATATWSLFWILLIHIRSRLPRVLVFYTSCTKFVILAWMADDLLCRQTWWWMDDHG